MENPTNGWDVSGAVWVRAASRCECRRSWCFHAGTSERCGRPLGPHEGHLVPKSLTGPHTSDNCELLCPSCSGGFLS